MPDRSSQSAIQAPHDASGKGLASAPRRPTPLLEYADVGIEYIPPPKRLSLDIGEHFIRRLRAAKNMLEVHFHSRNKEGQFGEMKRRSWISTADVERDPSSMYADTTEYDEYDWPVCIYPVESWAEMGYRGMIIRSYVNEASNLDLVHIRMLTRARHDGHASYIGARRRWQEMTRYRGRTIPYHALLEAYTVDGVDPDWLNAERGMVLSEEAWKVLDDWVGWAEENGVRADWDSLDNDGLDNGNDNDAAGLTDHEDGFEQDDMDDEWDSEDEMAMFGGSMWPIGDDEDEWSDDDDIM